MSVSEALRDQQERARAAVAGNPTWYHTIELAPGVSTPGFVDLRALARDVLPDDLAGLRALDCGTFDGFWAFEMEKRGANVVAIDVEKVDDAEWPPNNRERLLADLAARRVELGLGFRLARETLGSSVDRRLCPIYELSADRIGGQVDLAFLGALQLHLRDPVRALERIHQTLRPGGKLLMFEPFTMRHTLLHPRTPLAELQPLSTPFNWWYPNIAGLRALMQIAGFADVKRHKVRYIKGNEGMSAWYVAMSGRRTERLRG
ncbi:MAG: methyltransferase domain-containing protein [Solirubrobacteraceae bacterium]